MDESTLLLRAAAADALTVAGYPVSYTTLATLACRGGGPKFRKFGRTPLYRWGDLLEWAEERSTPLGRTATECEVLRRQA